MGVVVVDVDKKRDGVEVDEEGRRGEGRDDTRDGAELENGGGIEVDGGESVGGGKEEGSGVERGVGGPRLVPSPESREDTESAEALVSVSPRSPSPRSLTRRGRWAHP